MGKIHFLVLLISFYIIISCKEKKPDTIEITNLATKPPKDYETVSFLGVALKRLEFPESTKSSLDSNLQVAKENLLRDSVENNYIWYGRRLAYLMRYNDAIEAFTLGLKSFPDSYRLLRHRGHRYITTRRLKLGINDLKRASELIQGTQDQIEPDGAPNKFNIPLSTDHFNIWYHLGLAYYLKQDFEDALIVYEECMKVSNNNDLLIATTDWYYMTLRRLGKTEQAEALLKPITEDMEILENTSYHKRLMFYKGIYQSGDLLSVDSLTDDNDLTLLTQGYGLGNWYFYNGKMEEARNTFNKVIEGQNWAAFGFIAAEVEISHWKP